MFKPILATTIAIVMVSGLAAQRLIHTVGAAQPGTSFDFRLHSPTASTGNAFSLFLSNHHEGSLTIPGIGGKLLLNPSLLLAIGAGTLTTPTTDVGPYPVPNTPALIGTQADVQFLDVGTTSVDLSDNEVTLTIITNVGTTLSGLGGTGSTTGMVFQTTKQATAGAPALVKDRYGHAHRWDTGRMEGSLGIKGYVQGYEAQNGATSHHCDPYIFKGGRPTRDMRDGTFPMGFKTQHGNFMLMRDSEHANEFFCVMISDGKIREISGTRLTSTATTTTPAQIYGDNWAFTPDGNVAIGIVDRDSVGGDKILLIRLDGKTWAAATSSSLPPHNGNTETIFVLESTTINVFDDYTSVANEVVIQSSSAGILWAPLDGSAVAKVATHPNSGTNKAPVWFHSPSRRVSDDLKTVCYVRGANTSSSIEHDVYAVTNISKAGVTIVNVSGFTTRKDLDRFWGDDLEDETNFDADISPDGKYIAFIGDPSPSGPEELYLAKTDGTQAGSVVAIPRDGTANGFPTTTLFFGMPHWLPGTTTRQCLVFAGTATNSFDLFMVTLTTGNPIVINLTNKGNLNVTWALESDNNNFFYFLRDYTSTTQSFNENMVGVGPTGTVFNVTGNEFLGGTTVNMEFDSTEPENHEFRLAPNATNEIYFHTRPVRVVSGTTTTYSDANIYKFNFETGGQAVKVTNYTGTATSLTGVKYVDNLNPLSDGSVVYGASTGSPATTRPQTVTFHKGDGTSAPVEIGKSALGFWVSDGTIRVVESEGAVYWVQASSTSSGTPNGQILYMALINNTMGGHPVGLSGLPLASGSANNIVLLTASATK